MPLAWKQKMPAPSGLLALLLALLVPLPWRTEGFFFPLRPSSADSILAPTSRRALSSVLWGSSSPDDEGGKGFLLRSPPPPPAPEDEAEAVRKEWERACE